MNDPGCLSWIGNGQAELTPGPRVARGPSFRGVVVEAAVMRDDLVPAVVPHTATGIWPKIRLAKTRSTRHRVGRGASPQRSGDRRDRILERPSGWRGGAG